MKKILLLTITIIIAINTMAQKLPMQVQEQGLFIQGTIDNISTNCMFDTGGGITLISGKLFQKIKSHLTYKGPVTGFQHDGERIDGDVYIVPTITIGEYVAKQIPVLIWKDLDNSGLDAILSLQPFAKRAVTLDFVNKAFIIEDARSLSAKAKTAQIIPIKLDVYRDLIVDIFVPVILDNKITIDAEFDTGTPGGNLVVHPSFLKKLTADTAAAKKQAFKQLMNGNVIYDRVYKIPSISYQGNSQLAEKDKQAFFRDGMIYEGLIGAGMFKQSVLTIDISNQRFLVNKPKP